MSEIKGSLLTIVLAVAVFGVIFGIITVAMKENADTIADRMKEAAESTVTEVVSVQKSSSLVYLI